MLVRVDGERVTAVEPGAAGPAAGATRLAGLTVPGFANAHSHAFHRALRGRTQRGSGSFWTWREQMYAVAATLDPDRYHRLARATFAEMALAGVATVGEFHYLHHAPGGESYDDPNAMGAAVIAAAAEAGIRLTLLDTCYLRGGIGVDLDETQRRFSDGDALGWAARAAALADGPGVRIGAAIHSVRRGRPGGDRDRRRVGGRAGRAAACPRLGAAGRERAVRRRLRLQPDPVARRPGRPERPVHGGARHPRQRGRPHAARCGGGEVLPVPDHRARSRRRRRPGAGDARRRYPDRAGQRLPRRHRPARGGQGGRARRAPDLGGAGQP